MATTGRGKSGTIRNVLMMAALIVAVLILDRGIRFLVAPWSLGGDDATALGDWYAPVALDEGATGWLVMSLDYYSAEEDLHLGQTNLQGEGRYCVAGAAVNLDVSGGLDRGGTVEDFGFAEDAEDPPWILYIDGGQWDPAGPTLSLNGRYSYDPTGRHISQSGVAEPTMELDFVRATAEQMTADCLE